MQAVNIWPVLHCWALLGHSQLLHPPLDRCNDHITVMMDWIVALHTTPLTVQFGNSCLHDKAFINALNKWTVNSHNITIAYPQHLF